MANVKLVNGLALASMKTFDGLAAASVKTIYGVDATSGTTVPDPIYQWDFNENTGTTATDSIASSVLTLFPPDSTWGAAHTGASSIAFSGSGAPYITGTDVFDALRTGPFSLSMWVKPTSLASDVVLFFTGAGYQVSGAYVGVTAAGVVFFTTNQSGADQGTLSSSSAVSTGSWQHICVTRNGAVAKTYVNGVDVTSTSGTHINPATGSGSMAMGAYNLSILFYPGLIDQFYIYDVTLSPTEVAQLYINTQ